MARYAYLGELARPGLVKQYGPTLAIRFRLKDGSTQEIKASDPKRGFVIGQDIGINVTDDRVIRHLDADPRFKRL